MIKSPKKEGAAHPTITSGFATKRAIVTNKRFVLDTIVSGLTEKLWVVLSHTMAGN